MIAELEQQVNQKWGTEQFDWTIGKCPEGWFFYCGTPSEQKGKWSYKGYASTLTEVLQAMIDIDTENPAKHSFECVCKGKGTIPSPSSKGITPIICPVSDNN